MKDAFALLALEPCLVIDDQAIGNAYREAGRLAHPDAGGGEAIFADLRRAMEIVSSPSRRLLHWLQLRGYEVETRGAVDSHLMDLFARISEVIQPAEVMIRKRGTAKSALGLSLLERETQLCREAVEQAIAAVDAAIGLECAVFAALEAATMPDVEVAAKSARNLAFLEKWRAGLRGVYSRLV